MNIDTYLDSRKGNISESTLESQKSMLKTFERLAEIDGEPTVDDVNAFIEKAKKAYENATVKQILNTVKVYWRVQRLPNFDELKDLIKFKSPRATLSDSKRTFYTEKEVEKIIHSAEEPWNLFFALAYTYARRLKEVGILKKNMVNDRSIRWKIIKKAHEERYSLERSMLKGEWDEWLSRRMGKVKSYVFPACWKGQKWKYWIPQKEMEEACKKAQIRKDPSVHGLRHSRARHLVDSGTSLRTLKDGLLFHERLSTTQDIYGTDEEAVGKIPEVSL
ncbi:hypothetical protein AKJ56_02015 [candidate division MSBL1 archaeon SCGC-AAA382N08]|uniref:Tyr recombinase domain-containing protein n=1 Tax=candidate division MSBL1 archaeon SCGC-AAA382N08 TaxID=1698285 RepID=A0A133VNK9_9EURY|nr:hypothetical protein AKJ56_02015 [candidate division MSBL1 archaeon SCGC-AAA382N08]